MITAELYKKTWQSYTTLHSVGRVSLSKYCKEQQVDYRVLRDLMRDQSVHISRSKQHAEALLLPSIAHVTILHSCSSGVMQSCALLAAMMKGVRITMHSGVHISIREINGKDMSILIDTLKPQ